MRARRTTWVRGEGAVPLDAFDAARKKNKKNAELKIEFF